MAVELQKSPSQARCRFSVPVLVNRICDLAGREDVVGVQAILLEPGVGNLDEAKPVLGLLLDGYPDGVITHQTELFEEVGDLG